MAIAVIEEWLIHRDYNKGVAICKKLSANEALIEMLEEGADSFNRQQLHKELTRLNGAAGDGRHRESIADGKRTNIIPEGDFKTVSDSNVKKWDSRNFTSDVAA